MKTAATKWLLFLYLWIYIFFGNLEMGFRLFGIVDCTWKWHFYSPRGMSDQKLEEMSPDQQKEQIMFEKYIPNRLFSFPI